MTEKRPEPVNTMTKTEHYFKVGEVAQSRPGRNLVPATMTMTRNPDKLDKLITATELLPSRH